MDPVTRIRQLQERATAPNRTAKRAAWNAVVENLPEFVPTVRTLADRFAITGVEVEAGGETVAWGNVEGHEV